MGMATRKGIIKISRDDLAVLAEFETERLEATPIENPPDIARWDTGTDQPVVRQRYVKEDHDEIDGEPALPEGTVGYRWVNEDGDVVPTDRLTYVQRKPDGSVEEVSKRETTVLKDEPLPVEKWIPVDDIGSFLIDSTYEVWGREAEDEAELQELAEYIDDTGEAPMFEWLLQPAFLKTWGILVPEFDEDRSEFSLIVKVTQKTIEPDHPMPVLEEAEVSELLEEPEEHFVEQEAPG
jgi:hypothetical protein